MYGVSESYKAIPKKNSEMKTVGSASDSYVVSPLTLKGEMHCIINFQFVCARNYKVEKNKIHISSKVTQHL